MKADFNPKVESVNSKDNVKSVDETAGIMQVCTGYHAGIMQVSRDCRAGSGYPGGEMEDWR